MSKVEVEEILLQRHFLRNEKKIRQDFKRKIKEYMNYYNELNKNYNYSNLEKGELYRMVQKLNDANIERKNKKYAHLEELGSLKFYDLAEEVSKKEGDERKFNVIEMLRTFPLFGNTSS